MAAPLITITAARQLVLDSLLTLPSELVEIDEALGRALVREVRAAGDVPPFSCSAMDGYAVIAGVAGRILNVVGESRAGSPSDRQLSDGQAIRISTGGAVPSGATAVIPQEDVRADGGSLIETQADIAAGQNIRAPGEDMRAATTVLAPGTVLGPVALGAAVAAGVGTVTVARRPRVSVLCTGDELRAPGEPLGPGEIHNSNAPMLTALARRAGAATGPAQRLPDDRAATEAGVEAALAGSDVVIVSGGVSVGPHDHVKPVLSALGVTEVFWGVALQPGKPTWFGLVPEGPRVFGLPGNPVSAVVTFSLFVAPALAAMQGAPAPRPPRPEARLGTEVVRNPRREQAQRVRLQSNGTTVVAVPTGAQGSHILTSLLNADALAMIPAGDGRLAAGATVGLEALAG